MEVEGSLFLHLTQLDVSFALNLLACLWFGAIEYKQAAKRVLKTLTPSSPSRCTIDAGKFFFQYVHHLGPHICIRIMTWLFFNSVCSYLIESNVCYLTLAEKAYPKK